MDKLLDSFVKQLVKMKDNPINFIGITYLLGVELTSEEDVKDIRLMTEEVINKFQSLSNTKKKEIIKICKEGNKIKRGVENGDRTENAEHEN